MVVGCLSAELSVFVSKSCTRKKGFFAGFLLPYFVYLPQTDRGGAIGCVVPAGRKMTELHGLR